MELYTYRLSETILNQYTPPPTIKERLSVDSLSRYMLFIIKNQKNKIKKLTCTIAKEKRI